MGYIGIDRGIRDHWIYQDAEYLKVWLEMVILGRFSEEPHIELIDGDIITVNYGEFIFGRVKWSQRLKIGEQRLRTLITKLKKEQMIELVLEHRKCSVYRLVNYAKFNHESNHQSRQAQQVMPADANHQGNQQPTISQPSANHQSTTKEQSKQGNKVNKVIKEHSQDTVDLTNHLISWIQSNNPSAKIPTSLEKWNDEMERIERLDKYEYMQIRSVIDWCQQDSFWKSNVLSVPKLREKMGTLIMQMQRPKGGSNGKVSSFERLQQMHKEEITREASGHY